MEKTYLSDVYDSFLSSITDYTLLENPQYIEEDLFIYFKKARSKFYKCKQKLDLIEDDAEDLNGSYFGYKDGESIQLVNLTDYEIAILSHLMLAEYMRPQVISTEVMKQSLSDKDFKIYSQANQLRELNLLYRLIQKEAKVMITEYTYMGMTDNDRK